MAGLGNRRRNNADLDVEINMVPVMNMFLVLIPFLLMSSSFLHLRSIDASVPVRAASEESQPKDKKKEIEVTAVVKIEYGTIDLSATTSELTEKELKAFDSSFKWDKKSPEETLKNLSLALKIIKDKYPKSTTVILMPEADVIYEDIITVMDAARQLDEEVLFDKVVISSEVS